MRALGNVAATFAVLIIVGCASLPQTTAQNTPAGSGVTPGTRTTPQVTTDARTRIGLWTTEVDNNYLLAQTASGRKTVKLIDTAKNGCYGPEGVKVDHSRNVWIACLAAASGSGQPGVVEEYTRAGALENRYVPGCPSNVSGCQSFIGYGFDSALDSNGNMFASLNSYQMSCSPSCSQSSGAGFEWWPKGKGSAAPTLISLGDNCQPVCYVGFTDVDASGNLWFTFDGYNGLTEGYGLGEVTNPTTNPQLTVVEQVGNYSFYGGVYVSDGGKTLNVIDSTPRTIDQYHLPLSPSGAPFNVLGPTLGNGSGGHPVSGGFNKRETKMAIGDLGGWLDVGKVSSNTWSDVSNANFAGGLDGAAYTPSDK